jgi:[amino group carrier protein]-L-2-aminoadipate 6-kinase
MQELIVVKSGGGKGNTFETVLDNLAELWHRGQKWVYLHGGSDRTNEISEQLGYPPQFITTTSGFTSRRTDRRTLEIFTMVYAGEINKKVVEGLQKRNVNAIGLSGADGKILQGKRKAAIPIVENNKKIMLHDDYTGTITSVNQDLLQYLLENNYAPVLCPPAISLEHELINVDGDRAAASVANALQAQTLILLTNQLGVLKDINDPLSVIKQIAFEEIDHVMQTYAAGRMRIKLLAIQEALRGSVKRAIISPSTADHPISNALGGAGTQFIKE